MQVVVGFLIALFGLVTVFMGTRLATTLAGRSNGRFGASNALAFRLIGTVLAVLGLLYATGVVG
ncbi:hypothetical protein [Streptomyces griseorubiginosus]|uniref:hypothetical protein n=1 Tax=Streptomyces griseorubiginosus TaxID=67304 RepID=UPI002E8016A1|nr:hypothetical protein [Streptomyces griseorubiginosus]WUB41860.1 hypothetical protein OHN19_00390 [Streptomyces griseorubiginosus]WUB50380.1 hypothetical protein OG942_00385 [Streptomyces griseorubiginosus]